MSCFERFRDVLVAKLIAILTNEGLTICWCGHACQCLEVVFWHATSLSKDHLLVKYIWTTLFTIFKIFLFLGKQKSRITFATRSWCLKRDTKTPSRHTGCKTISYISSLLSPLTRTSSVWSWSLLTRTLIRIFLYFPAKKHLLEATLS